MDFVSLSVIDLKSSSCCMLANGMGGKMWAACRWPVLLQLEWLRIRRDPVFRWSQAVLWEGHDFCCNERQETLHLNNVRTGNKVVFIDLLDCSTDWEICRNDWIREMNSCLRKVALDWAAEYLGELESSYLVDPASSHMLVSKIKPCMSKYKQICTVKLRMAH